MQKGIDASQLDDRERRGRWKRFVQRWNGGSLAAGWYDPDLRRRLQEEGAVGKGSAPASSAAVRGRRDGSSPPPRQRKGSCNDDEPSPPARDPGGGPEEQAAGSDGSDSDYGPLPIGAGTSRSKPHDAAIPRLPDLAARDEDLVADRARSLSALRSARRADRLEQREREEELAPRADPGTRERKLEKKREAAAAARSVARDRSPGTLEVREDDLMGGGDDAMDEYKRLVAADAERRRQGNAWREERERARKAEKAERLEYLRAKYRR